MSSGSARRGVTERTEYDFDPKKQNWAGLTGFLLSATGMFATMYATQAILPELGRSFGVGPSRAGLTISALVVSIAVGAWLWGPLSDYWGRRRCLIVASTLLTVPTTACAFAPNFSLLLALRSLQGLCMPGLLVVGVPYAVEAFGEWLGGRVMGYYVLSLVVGGLIGRVGVALASAEFGWRWALGGLALLPLAASILMRFTLPNVEVSGLAVRQGLSTLGRQLHNRKLLQVIAGGCALFFTFVGAFSFVTYRLQAQPFDLSTTAVGLVFLLWGMGALSPAAGGLADRVGWAPVLTGALVLSSTALLLSLPAFLPTLIVALALMAGAMFVGTTAANLGVATAGGSDRGMASSLYFSCYYSSGALAGFLPGLAWQGWQWPGVVALGLLVLSASITAILLTSVASK